MATTDFIAAIELSSSKISGIAGKKNSDGSIQVLAYAREDASSFIHKGVIYNIDKTAQALTSITNKLENQLNNSIAKVYVGIGGQSLRTVKNAVSRTLEEEGIISQELVDSICDENLEVPLADMSVLDVAPQEYKIDNTLQADPVGVAGQHITGQFLNIVARASLKKNLEHSFEQAKVEIADLLIAPIALANAVLTENEMRSGCALVDFDAFQCVLFADETDGGEVPAADASFFVAAARFQHLRVQGPGSCRVMSDGRLGHDFDLRHVSGFVAIGCPDAVASRVAATDDEDFLAFAVDDVFRRDDDAFEDTVLL